MSGPAQGGEGGGQRRVKAILARPTDTNVLRNSSSDVADAELEAEGIHRIGRIVRKILRSLDPPQGGLP